MKYIVSEVNLDKRKSNGYPPNIDWCILHEDKEHYLLVDNKRKWFKTRKAAREYCDSQAIEYHR